LKNLVPQHFNIVTWTGDDVISDVIKNALDKDGHLTKAFQNEKHNTASQLLKE